jgi:hypothetical protein
MKLFPRLNKGVSRLECVRRFWAVLAVVFLLMGHGGRAAVFLLDDGSVNLFGGTSNGDLLALNRFETGPLPVVIDRILVLWSPLSLSVSPRVALYSDPNGDGDPSDAVALMVFAPFMQPGAVISNNTSFQSYDVPPTLVSGSFFVGAYLSDREPSFNPAIGVDTSSPVFSGQSWVIENSTAGGLDLQNPIGTATLVTTLETYVSGNHMIRAQGTVVPEPGILCVFLIGLAALAMRRGNR